MLRYIIYIYTYYIQICTFFKHIQKPTNVYQDLPMYMQIVRGFMLGPTLLGHTPTSWDGLLIHHLPKTISRKGLLKIYRYVYVYVYLHTQVHPYPCIYVYIYTYKCMYVMYVCMDGWMHACMYIYIYTIHKWIRTRIQKHTHGLFTYVHIHTLGFHRKP